MKIRKGFVSNSSSTSFLIKITPQNKHLVHYNHAVRDEEILFPNNDKYYGSKIDKLISDGYIIVDKRENYIIFSKYKPITKLCSDGLGRNTVIGFGKELTEYISILRREGFDWDFNDEIIGKFRKAFDEYGLENILFIRESDEGMGGYLPDELKQLVDSNDVICEFEYH